MAGIPSDSGASPLSDGAATAASSLDGEPAAGTGALSTSEEAAAAPSNAEERAAGLAGDSRPGLHFTPPQQWMNDPNGLVYDNGLYHLFYQHHPDGLVWGPMHWGHAVSDDLVHWRHEPIALYPDELGAIFSGCCVVDRRDTSGLFEGGSGLVAIFTHADTSPRTDRPPQRQSLAYSSDDGKTWTKYAGNPVLSESELIDFRDPKVFWHAESDAWVMVIVAGDHARFYRSPNLREWELSGVFGPGEGSHDGVWECPDLFRLPVEGGEGDKWVLIVSIGDNPERAEGSRTQYFVGEFDGGTFVNDDPAAEVRWLDYGRDHYAGVSWSDIPAVDGRRILIGWMNNWKYANLTPAERFRGAMTLPRELSLTVDDAGRIRLRQMPVRELERLRLDCAERQGGTIDPQTPLVLETPGELLELEAEFALPDRGELELIFHYADGSETLVGYDAAREQLALDRSGSGRTGFHPLFGCRHQAYARRNGNVLRLRLWLDRQAIEVYAADGLTTMTDQIFPEGPLIGLIVRMSEGIAECRMLRLHGLRAALGLGEESKR